MPSRHTFTIKPIAELISRYVGDGKGWIDPFAGDNSPAEFTNDLNPNTKARVHFKADTYCLMSSTYKSKGFLFDPPYSLRQIKECYKGVGIEKLDKETTLDASFSKVKNIIANLVKDKGYVISCGWNTNGMGKKRGFKIIEILLVPHGGHHNDTIVVVEQKVQGTL